MRYPAHMTDARFTLSSPSSSLAQAQDLAEAIENHAAIDALAVTINETDEARDLWNVVAYFADEGEAHAAAAALSLAGADIAPVPDVDWVRQSLQGLAPVIAGRFFLHGSHDRNRRAAAGVPLEIDAGTAFGTGHHGTTAGCLMALDTLLKRQKPRRIFDLGCGTGVLAIAAAKATRMPVLATDIDPESVRVTHLNARANGVGPSLRSKTAPGLHHRIIRDHAPYDLIFANILARPLAALAQGLAQLLSPGGTLVLSGLTLEQQRWIKACYRNRGLVHAQTIIRGNWVALVMQKPRPHPSPKTKRPGASPERLQITPRAPGWELDA